jgi:hypothetical protein
LLQRAGPTFAARWLALSALANHARDRWHAEIAEDNCVRLRHTLLNKAAALAGPGVSAAVRSTVVTTLIGQARDARLFIEEELFRAAGYETPGAYWEDAVLARPTMRLEALVHLLATHVRDPAEKQFDPRVSLAHLRIRWALDEWIAAGHLQAFEGRDGRPCLKNPRTAIVLLERSPATADLIPPTLRTFLNQTASAGAAECVPCAPTLFTSSGDGVTFNIITFNELITAPAVKEGAAPPPRTDAPLEPRPVSDRDLELAIKKRVKEYSEATGAKPNMDNCVLDVQSKLPEARRGAIREEYRRQKNETFRRPANMPLKRGPQGQRKSVVNKQQ